MRTLSCALLLAGLAGLALSSGGAADDKPEPGFTPLFNGKDLTGWKMAKGDESLDGKAEAAGGRFKVKDGKLVIDPSVKGDVTINTAKQFGKDVVIKFEFLPGEKCNNDLYLRGNKFDIKKDLKHMKDGQWNQFEVVVQGDKAEFKVNGQTERMAPAKPGATPFGVRAEYGVIEIRNMRYKEAP
jgi:hypothetical protein